MATKRNSNGGLGEFFRRANQSANEQSVRRMTGFGGGSGSRSSSGGAKAGGKAKTGSSKPKAAGKPKAVGGSARKASTPSGGKVRKSRWANAVKGTHGWLNRVDKDYRPKNSAEAIPSEGRSGKAVKGRNKATSRKKNRRISTKWWRIGRSPWMSDAEWQVAKTAWEKFKKQTPPERFDKWVNDTHADAFTKRKETDPSRRDNNRGEFDFRKAGIKFVMNAIRDAHLDTNNSTMQHVGQARTARRKWNKQKWSPQEVRRHMKKMYYTFSFGPDGKVK